MDAKANGYKHPRTTPGSRVDDRRQRAAELRRHCLVEHPHVNGHCTVVHGWAARGKETPNE